MMKKEVEVGKSIINNLFSVMSLQSMSMKALKQVTWMKLNDETIQWWRTENAAIVLILTCLYRIFFVWPSTRGWIDKIFFLPEFFALLYATAVVIWGEIEKQIEKEESRHRKMVDYIDGLNQTKAKEKEREEEKESRSL